MDVSDEIAEALRIVNGELRFGRGVRMFLL